MLILGIETSCDETAAAVLEKKADQIKILSNIVASSSELQAKYGGVIPEQAAREQLKTIIPVITEAFEWANIKPADLEAIAVTVGPGLIGSLLVGVETAKVLSRTWQRPLIPINHLIGHFYSNWIDYGSSRQARTKLFFERSGTAGESRSTTPIFPCIGLLASGGHTDLVLFENHNKYKYLGGTRDDAAGECFDKCARLLGLPYPGGPEISKLALSGDPKAYNLPRPMITTDDFDFSYSGLKTAVANLLASKAKSESHKVVGEQVMQESGNLRANSEGFGPSGTLGSDELSNLCASIEQAIIDPLVVKTIKAAKEYKVSCIILGGGVAANQKLKKNLKLEIKNWKLEIDLFVPPPILCTDNGAMIASAAFFQKEALRTDSIQADPSLSLAY